MVEKLWTVDCSQRVLSTLNALLESPVCPAYLHTALWSWGLFSKHQMWPWVFSVNLDWNSTRLRWEGKATCPLAIGWKSCPGEVGLETAPSI